jgi:preprotein translocase subunit YajC
LDPSFLFVVAAMFLIMWLMLIRPQRQQQRRHAAMIEALKPGDEIITNGGIYGDVVGVEEDRVIVEIAEDVEVEVVKRAIATVVPPEESEPDDVDEAADEDSERSVGAEPAAEDAARR